MAIASSPEQGCHAETVPSIDISPCPELALEAEGMASCSSQVQGCGAATVLGMDMSPCPE
eukprot:CAMPEP_0118974780 /NCGR_PEP_ID=MMETSP1173-20130426/13352_1 /TAXON_ID=1034831 /ORGANISM="Rhizochromulina marina cf, Strain CCMP1243" /LENGTH=59 /DNA_ID=CAMNT_0006924573 /DNA_START=37 /DNA_END=216 /DNA_ORIENTATION=+